MANPFNATINGAGQENWGLAWAPAPSGNYPYSVDGLGLVTLGFVWSVGSVWFDCYAGVTTTWSGCSCATLCA